MNVRQFGLKNAKSSRNSMYDLMDVNHLLLNPSGLGWGTDISTMRVGQEFISIEENTVQPSPSAEIWFSSYKEYETFVQFCQVGKLTLCYKPSEEIPWRYLDCGVNIEKTEINKDTHYLACDVTFKGLSRWYESLLVSDSFIEVVEDTKIFMYRADSDQYGYKYNQKSYVPAIDSSHYYQYSEAADGVIIIKNGPISSYFRLTIHGPVTNPVYQLYVDGKPTKNGKILADILEGQKLIINTNPKDMEITRITTSGRYLENLYGSSDFTTERIFMVPSGDSYIIVTGDDDVRPASTIEVKKIV